MKSKRNLLGLTLLFTIFHCPTIWARNSHFPPSIPADELHDVKLKWIKARKKIKFCKRLHKISVIVENKTKNQEIAQVYLYKDGDKVARWIDVDLRQKQDRVLFYFYNPAEDAGNTISWSGEIAISDDQDLSDNSLGPIETEVKCTNGIACKNKNAAEVCDDGDVCTEDHCVNGSCVNSPVLCENDNNPCTIDECNPLTGECNSPAEDGISCEDGNDCNGAETCQGGECTGGEPIVCISDCNPCTVDECNPETGQCDNRRITGCVVGDINGNGCVDYNDAVCLYDYIFAPQLSCVETCEHCDIYCDQNVDSLDVECLYNWLIGVESCLNNYDEEIIPCGEN